MGNDGAGWACPTWLGNADCSMDVSSGNAENVSLVAPGKKMRLPSFLLLAPSLLIVLACLLTVHAVISGACKALQAWSTGSHSILIFSGRDNSYMNILFLWSKNTQFILQLQVGFVIKVLTDL